jgi:hypothetical protein
VENQGDRGNIVFAKRTETKRKAPAAARTFLGGCGDRI